MQISMATSAQPDQPEQRDSVGTGPLHLRVVPLSHRLAKQIVERHHYLHTMPGGTELCFGVIAGGGLKGAITFGAGPANAYRLVRDARPEDCLTLSRFWLKDELPRNSESRVIGMTLRILRRSTDVKFVITYADPAEGHTGVIYQATNWLYTGLSEATPMFDFGDGIARHSRTVSHSLGTQNTSFLAGQGFDLKRVRQKRKHRYIYFLHRTRRNRLTCPILPYPKLKEALRCG